ncbi:BEL1-like homeodomain 4 [Olea europaea subsp. europaea]|uniref:BEL1-like homeodomain 4 n=1 Tax=Olea europaea subsp. europaea TaxID=158383 RepID=A0A8S0THG9_OLEEU|nr:BEL1-like homeodomain 4 [Olea europaea subsp. europaea]
MFCSEISSGSLKNSNTPLSILDIKPCHGHQEVYSSFIKQPTEIPCQNLGKHHDNVHHSSSLYQTELQDVVHPENIATGALEMPFIRQQNSKETSHDSWAVVGGGELPLLPTYADQMCLKSSSDLISKPANVYHQWSSELDYSANKNADGDSGVVANDNSNTQGLSLSLSSAPSHKGHGAQFLGRDPSHNLNSRNINLSAIPDSKALNSEYLSSNQNLSNASNCLGVPSQDIVRKSSFVQCNLGPLGPFTGYATILRSSNYMKPAQKLLDEFSSYASPKPIEMPTMSNIFGEVRVSVDVSAAESVVGGTTGDSCESSFMFYRSNERGYEPGGENSLTNSGWPEYLQRKAKLLHMQDEVSRSYKQYHQQMKMVFSSFESVAGLNAAIPYISLALKTVSGHFRCLKNAIADQLQSIRSTLREDLWSPTNDASNSKADSASTRLKFIDSCFQKQKVGGHLGLLETQRAWRPQRGLPEHAVSVLRAWLFDHFLHPYPTDTDKHMLAAKTGLTRNQVSNWFINARVRVWKPMVEEIHMLETKGTAETGRPDEGNLQSNDRQFLNKLNSSAEFDKQVEFSRISSSEFMHPHIQSQDNHSRVDYRIPDSLDGSLMGFSPYHQSGMEIGGIGSVSLTLGLRRTAESAQLPQFRQHFEDHMVRDSVG